MNRIHSNSTATINLPLFAIPPPAPVIPLPYLVSPYDVTKYNHHLAQNPHAMAGIAGSQRKAAPIAHIGVFWDIENCQVPRGKSALFVVQMIRERFFQPNFIEVEFVTACDVRRESAQIIQELNDAQVTIIHVAGGSKNAADEKLRQAMRRYVDAYSVVGRSAEYNGSHGTPAILLITTDINFACDLSDYRHRKLMHIILLHQQHVSDALLICAHEHHDFNAGLLGIPARPRITFQDTINLQFESAYDVLVSGLPRRTGIERIHQCLTRLISNGDGEIISIDGHYATIRFKSQKTAMRATTKIHGETVYGSIVQTTGPLPSGSYVLRGQKGSLLNDALMLSDSASSTVSQQVVAETHKDTTPPVLSKKPQINHNPPSSSDSENNQMTDDSCNPTASPPAAETNSIAEASHRQEENCCNCCPNGIHIEGEVPVPGGTSEIKSDNDMSSSENPLDFDVQSDGTFAILALDDWYNPAADTVLNSEPKTRLEDVCIKKEESGPVESKAAQDDHKSQHVRTLQHEIVISGLQQTPNPKRTVKVLNRIFKKLNGKIVGVAADFATVRFPTRRAANSAVIKVYENFSGVLVRAAGPFQCNYFMQHCMKSGTSDQHITHPTPHKFVHPLKLKDKQVQQGNGSKPIPSNENTKLKAEIKESSSCLNVGTKPGTDPPAPWPSNEKPKPSPRRLKSPENLVVVKIEPRADSDSGNSSGSKSDQDDKNEDVEDGAVKRESGDAGVFEREDPIITKQEPALLSVAGTNVDDADAFTFTKELFCTTEHGKNPKIIYVVTEFENFWVRITKMLVDAGGKLEFTEFYKSYKNLYGWAEVGEKYGVPLDHLITVIPGVELKFQDGHKNVLLKSAKGIENAPQRRDDHPNLARFKIDVVNLLKVRPHCTIELDQLESAYKNQFGIAQFQKIVVGTTKDFIKTHLNSSLHFLGDASQEFVTLTHTIQMKRLAVDILKMLKFRQMKPLPLQGFDEEYETVIGFEFEASSYGMCSLGDLLKELILHTAMIRMQVQNGQTCLSLA